MYRKTDYEMNNVDLWVSEDGSYGSGDIAFFSTEDWTGKDFNELDEAPESEKLETAMRIHKRLSRRITKESLNRIDVRVFIIDSDGVEEIK
jgi:predicted Zn-dependent protease